MTPRLLTESDYDTLLPWWKWHRFSAPSRKMLPNNGLGGIMITKDGVDIYAGFLYMTNSSMAWMEFIISNPEYRESDRKEAEQFLINELSIIAKGKGYEFLYTIVKNQHLINSLDKCEFKTTTEKATEMIRIL